MDRRCTYCSLSEELSSAPAQVITSHFCFLGEVGSDVEVNVTLPAASAGGEPLTLARVRPQAVSGPQVACIRALLGCAEGAVLSCSGGSVQLIGRLEGDLPSAWFKDECWSMVSEGRPRLSKEPKTR